MRWWIALVLMGCAPASDFRGPVTSFVETDGDEDDEGKDTALETDTGTPDDPGTGPGTETEDTGTPLPSGVPLPAPAYLDLSVVQSLSDTIDAILAGTNSAVRVVDAENGEVVYELNPNTPLKPASNTKLFTTAAAMDLLGEEHSFRVSAWAPALPDANGQVSSLTVLSEHDSTWSTYLYEDEFFVADRLADMLWQAGVRRVSGALTLAGEVLVDGYVYGTYSASWHRGVGADVLQDALTGRGITVGSVTTSSSLATPPGVLLVERESPPLSVVAHPINVYSHNEMTDILARHNGWALWHGSTYADGEAAVLDFLSGLGLPTAGIVFNDGSGLSHGNRITARLTTELLLEMMTRPAGQAWERTFSVSGVKGTIGNRLTGTDTWGRVYAKTGTLSDTITLSGVLYNRYDGHRYVFSVLQNSVGNQSTARSRADNVVRALAVDLRSGGTRPLAPVLQTVRHVGGDRVEVRWSAVPGAQHYGVWVSEDGLVWDRAHAFSATGTSHTLGGLPLDRPVYVRVTAHTGARESEPSDVYAATPSQSPVRLLVVDGFDRWDGQAENPLRTGHDFVRATAEAIRRPVDSAANEAIVGGAVDLLDYDAVIWVLGEEGTADQTFDATERQRVQAYLQAGGKLFVSGAELGWDLDAQGTTDSRAFMNDVLRAAYVGDDAGTYSALPVAGGLFDGLGELGFYTPARIVVEYPDRLAPSPGARTELVYVGGLGGNAAVSYSGAYKVVVFGFPFESVDRLTHRQALMDRVLTFFGL